MKKIIIILLLVTYPMMCSSITAAPRENNDNGKSKKSRPFIVPYCECLFSKQKNIYKAPLLLWEYHGSAKFKQDGKFIRLYNVTEEMGGKLKDNIFFQFSNNEITIIGNGKVTKTCPESDEKCSSVNYEGNVDIIEKNQKSNYQVWGRCGC